MSHVDGGTDAWEGGPAVADMFKGAKSFIQDLLPWSTRLRSSIQTKLMGSARLSTAAQIKLAAAPSLLALRNETNAAPACTGAPTGLPCHTLFAGTSYTVQGPRGTDALSQGLNLDTLMSTLRGKQLYRADSFRVDLDPKVPGLLFVDSIGSGAWTLNPNAALINTTYTAPRPSSQTATSSQARALS